MNARTRDPETTRTAILDAAEDVFLARGFNGAPMSEIARQAGVTKSLIHHHFGSKQELWDEVKMRRFEVYAERQLEMIDRSEPSAALLKQSMETYFHFLKHNQPLVRILAWVFLERGQDECMKMDKGLMDAGAEKIRESQARGEIRSDIDPRFLLFTMVGIVQHWFQDRAHVLQHLDGVDESQVDDAYLADVLKIFFEGVLPR